MSSADSWQVDDHLQTRDGRLTIDGVDSVELATRYGTPLFVFSERRIRHNVDRLKRIRDVIESPLKICYAAKANSTMAILRAIRDAGADIEVNSGGELWKALKIGFTGTQIIFNGTSKEVWEIEDAIRAGIYAIQVDSLYELALIDETARRLDLPANVSLRLVPGIETGTHSGLRTALLSSKFGMMPDEAFSAFRRYNDSAYVHINGIHLHIGSQNPDAGVYAEALHILAGGVARILGETGRRLQHINLGGGFPVNYLRGTAADSSISTDQRSMLSAGFGPAAAIAAAWKQHASGDDLRDVTLLIEPGRSIIADAGVCLTAVRNSKTRPVAGQSDEETWLLTDAGFNILLSMETYKWYYHLISAGRADEAHETDFKIAGPLCDGGDVYFDIEGAGRLPEHRKLPGGTGPGDILAMLNCGAYTLSQASQYNGRPLPPVVMVRENGKVELIRKRNRLDDLITNDLY